MNKQMLFILVSIIAFSSSDSRSACPTTTFIGALCLPPAVITNPNLPAYYKGSQIEIHRGTYEIKEDMCSQEFFFLFTLSPIMARSTTTDDYNTIRHLVMPEKAVYKCFKASHTHTPSRFGGQKSVSWSIEQIKLRKGNCEDADKKKNCLVIPDNTVIVLSNPDFIATLEQDDWKSLNSTFRLPKIVFKETISEKAIEDMTNKALLASLDLNAFHRKPEVVQELKQGRPAITVSMVTG